MRTIRFFTVLNCIVLFLFSCGCPDENDVTKFLNATSKEWFIDYGNIEDFYMIDNNGISESFSLNNQNNQQFHVNEFSRNESCIKNQVEQYYRWYNSTYNHSFQMSLYAYYDGDEVTLKVNDIDFRYNFEKKAIVDIFFNNLVLSKYYTEDGMEGDAIYSTVEFIDTMSVNQKSYTGIMHFHLNDFIESQNDNTVIDIYYAKHYGLIKYKLVGGIEYNRLPE